MAVRKLLGFSLGPAVASFVSLISVPILTRIVTPETYAQVSLAQVTIQLLLFAIFSGFDQGYVREFYEEKSKRKLLLHTLGLNLGLYAVVVLSLWCFSEPISNFLFGYIDFTLLILIAVIAFQSVILRYIQLAFRMEGSAISFSLVLIIQSITNVLLILSFISLNIATDLKAILSANAISIFIVIVFGILKLNPPVHTKEIVNFDKSLFLKLARYSLPLLVSTLFMWVLYSADQYMLRIMSDYQQLGLYAASYKLIAALVLFQTIISTYWVPVSLAWAKEDKSSYEYERVGLIVSGLLLIVFLLAILFKSLLVLILGVEFRGAVDIFPYLLLFPIYYTLAEVGSSGIAIARKTKLLMPITFICACLNVGLNLYLIPMMGAKGAAISTAFTFILYFYLRVYVSNRYWKKLTLKNYNYVTLICIITLMFHDNSYINYLCILLLLLTLTFLYFKEKELIKFFINQKIFSSKNHTP
jgi:O-antigen/teichoic acid export membrane protein